VFNDCTGILTDDIVMRNEKFKYFILHELFTGLILEAGRSSFAVIHLDLEGFQVLRVKVSHQGFIVEILHAVSLTNESFF